MSVSSRDSVVYAIEFQRSLVVMVTFVGNSALKISRVWPAPIHNSIQSDKSQSDAKKSRAFVDLQETLSEIPLLEFLSCY